MAKITKINKITNLVSRRDFSKLDISYFDQPNLLEIQKNSYNQFFSNNSEALKNLFNSIYPISIEKNQKFLVKFESLNFKNQNGVKDAKGNVLTQERCIAEGETYAKSLFVKTILINNETGEVIPLGQGKGKGKKATEATDGELFANIPIMTDNGTFIINGVEKNVISQIVRAPGLYSLNKSKIKLSNKKKENKGQICELLPGKGALMNFFIKDGIIRCNIRNARHDAAPEFNVVTMLKAFGMRTEDIIELFQNNQYIEASVKDDLENKKTRGLNIATILDDRMIRSFRGECISGKNSTIQGGIFNRIRKLVKEYVDLENSKASDSRIKSVLSQIISEWSAKYFVEELAISTKAIESEQKDVSYIDIFSRFFMDNRLYDLLGAGRYKINQKLRISERLLWRTPSKDICDKSGKIIIKAGEAIYKEDLDKLREKFEANDVDCVVNIKCENNSYVKKQDTHLNMISVFADEDSKELEIPLLGLNKFVSTTSLNLADIISAISYAISWNYDIGNLDDIEHLGNKRLRLLHEQVFVKLNAALVQIEKDIKNKLTTMSPTKGDVETKAKFNEKAKSFQTSTNPFKAAIKNFFNTHQLTQFIDQQNPLAELTSKRKVSTMGEGGISREDPNVELRDIHHSQYGRICPIESPEGQNVGLIHYLTSFAKVDDNGFIVSPYRKVVDGVATDKIEWLTALKEDKYVVAESGIEINAEGKLANKPVPCRFNGEESLYSAKEVNYVAIAPQQMLSISSCLIPFVESDDGHRAEMGTHMMCQSLPLIKTFSPAIGTGSEYKIAHDSKRCLVAEEAGEVTYVDSQVITVDKKDYKLTKFTRSNQGACLNHTPIVSVGQHVKAGEIIADGSAMNNGELSLGQNLLIAFTAWRGYNFEDAIVLSDRLFKEDLFTSIKIEEITVGQYALEKNKKSKDASNFEIITRDIPNASEDSKRYLDENGVIMVGANVKEGDILVGKVIPKDSSDLTPEEKLLEDLFGKSAKQKDVSKRVEHGKDGVVFKVEQFDSDNGETKKIWKIYIAQKRKIEAGDKLAGRHGNKGVTSIVVPQENMPHLADGTPIDVCLNPQGIPSRMNLGQVLETHLGYGLRNLAINDLKEIIFNGSASEITDKFGIDKNKAALLLKAGKEYVADVKAEKAKDLDSTDIAIILKNAGLTIDNLNLKVSTPSFSGAKLDDIKELMQEAGIDTDENGKVWLTDGITGEQFDKPITVGLMYMLKLDHMIDDKIHARAAGPSYSRITQQPLGGKGLNGGQRLGEMEVWALEAYGASYNLRELLTIKSDDVKGRTDSYSAIIRKRHFPEPGIPEGFKLLTKQLQGLCLQLDVVKEDGSIVDMNSYTSTQYTQVEDSEEKPVKISEHTSSYGDAE